MTSTPPPDKAEATSTAPEPTSAVSWALTAADLKRFLAARAKRWRTVDAAIRSAHHDETEPPGAPAINYAAMATPRAVYTTPRVLTVRAKSKAPKRGRTPEQEGRDFDKGVVLAILAQLDRVSCFVVVRYAHRDSYRVIRAKLRDRGMRLTDSEVPRMHKAARDHVADRLERVGLLEPY